MYRQVTLYAVRGNYDHDIIEGSYITVKTNDGTEAYGKLTDVGWDSITVMNVDEDEERKFFYSDIKNISHDI